MFCRPRESLYIYMYPDGCGGICVPHNILQFWRTATPRPARN